MAELVDAAGLGPAGRELVGVRVPSPAPPCRSRPIDAEVAILRLLAERAKAATICPSEVARLLTGDQSWREAMPAVHAAIDRLVAKDQVRLSWKGTPLALREGPYRIARRP